MTRRKKKIFTAFLIFSTLFVGNAYANQDSGIQMKKWYEKLEIVVQEEVKESIKAYRNSLQPALENEKQRLLTNSTAQVTEFAENEKNNRNSAIKSYFSTYSISLNEMREKLFGSDDREGKISEDFSNFVEQNSLKVDSYYDQQVDSIIDEISYEIDGHIEETKK
ncbi:hypothetical protein [Peribacillus alkalitolerans]|uniref:hypothetical protein n=1 Tax=Peribacillus alkalitolerans TaxID=1550385 RepID=UPI0013D498DA|nr:hypothetical protein [Peribacillus alkalitolerans]